MAAIVLGWILVVIYTPGPIVHYDEFVSKEECLESAATFVKDRPVVVKHKGKAMTAVVAACSEGYSLSLDKK